MLERLVLSFCSSTLRWLIFSTEFLSLLSPLSLVLGLLSGGSDSQSLNTVYFIKIITNNNFEHLVSNHLFVSFISRKQIENKFIIFGNTTHAKLVNKLIIIL